MAGIAYSYLRFSTSEQAHGDSRRRQLVLAERYAAAHGLTLDGRLSFRDLGVSAFRGRNARVDALSSFLEAIELGLVPRGSTLLIESLDRLAGFTSWQRKRCSCRSSKLVLPLSP
jgi:DNA invertase Pin-like site-specific DNA recombinase